MTSLSVWRRWGKNRRRVWKRNWSRSADASCSSLRAQALHHILDLRADWGCKPSGLRIIPRLSCVTFPMRSRAGYSYVQYVNAGHNPPIIVGPR